MFVICQVTRGLILPHTTTDSKRCVPGYEFERPCTRSSIMAPKHEFKWCVIHLNRRYNRFIFLQNPDSCLCDSTSFFIHKTPLLGIRQNPPIAKHLLCRMKNNIKKTFTRADSFHKLLHYTVFTDITYCRSPRCSRRADRRRCQTNSWSRTRRVKEACWQGCEFDNLEHTYEDIVPT